MLERPVPIYSEREDDVALREDIDGFVIALAENVDLLQDTHCDGDLAGLAERSRVLSERSSQLGFATLADVASQVERASRDGKAEDAEAAILELTDVARRIRLGHRGAAG